MDSWNETDMLTGLPIEVGTPVVGFLIVDNKNTARMLGRTSYADTRWQPISMPIIGIYNDYGKIGNIENSEEIQSAIDKLAEFNFKLVCGHEPLSIQNDSISVERGEMVGNFDNKMMELVFVRKNLFDFIMETESSQQIITEYSDTLQEYLNAVVTFAPQLNDSMETTTSILLEIGRYQQHFECLLSGGHPSNAATLWLSKTGCNLSQTAAMTNFLNAMRLQWMPTSGYGKQTTINITEQVDFYKLVSKTAQEIYDKN